jgi:hypothetical protein
VLGLRGGVASARESGIQFSPDGKHVFVSKDVGTERWSITLNNDDGTVSGNVFRQDGGPAAFVFCTPGSAPNRFVCFGADACPSAPCDGEFTQIASDEVSLPDGFFAAPTSAPLSATSRSGMEAVIATPRDSGIQLSPDGKRVFVSKDVGTERWAITLNIDDGTVSGNVFLPGSPEFVFCTPRAQPNTYTCMGANACTTAPCGPFAPIGAGPVSLPAHFFDPPDAVIGAAQVSDDLTQVLEVGIGVPDANSLAAAAPASCPDGGTVNVGSILTQYDQCQVGQLICSGSVQTNNGTTLVGSLTCHHVARRRNLTLATNLVVSPDAAGPSLTGGIHATATETAADAFDLQYTRVNLSRSKDFHTLRSGALTVQDSSGFFGGTFTSIDQNFDGSQFILIRKFFPISSGFLILVLKLDVTTGKLTAQ